MKKTVLYFITFLSLINCKEANKDSKSTQRATNYRIKGQVFDKENIIIYLKKFEANRFQIIDSTSIINNSFLFEGNSTIPKKAVLQLKNHSDHFFFILSNEKIEIALNTSQFANSSITNSLINTKLKQIQKNSAAIYQKIDYLFPQLQKARMENDYEKLKEINTKINAIVAENQTYLTSYIQEHPDEFIAGLLLNDLWNSPKKDSIQLTKLAKGLDPNIQKIIDFSIP